MKTTITVEIKTAQKIEALERMKQLHLLDDVIKCFREAGKLFRSEGVQMPGGKRMGVLYWLTDEEEAMVKEWEEQTGNMVYHVIQNRTKYGMLYSFLYVSTDTEEWEMDNEDLKEGCPIAYVKNVDDEDCSEYDGIGIEPLWGALVRTA